MTRNRLAYEARHAYCVTVDFDTLADRAVAIRDRDRLEQERVPVDCLVEAWTPDRRGYDMAEELEEPREGLSRRALLNTAGAVGGTVLAASMLTGTAGAQTATSPVSANRYSLVVDGQEIATFSELTGIVAEVDPSEYWQTGTNGPTVTKLPGKQKPPTIVFRRAMTGGLELWAWHQAVRAGQAAAARRNCTLIMYGSTGKAVAKYFLTNAWPSKIELAGLKAGNSEVLMETVTLVAESLQRVAV